MATSTLRQRLCGTAHTGVRRTFLRETSLALNILLHGEPVDASLESQGISVSFAILTAI
jgi:hypothetical protein